MDDWEKLNETSLPEKEHFYSHLNMEDITDADYKHAERVCKDLKIKKLGKYHDLYLESDTLLFADVFQNFRRMCLEIYQLEFAKFLSVPVLAWQATLKKTKVKLDLLADIDMLLMVEKGIKGKICHSINRYAKANNKYVKDYDKNKEKSYLKYQDVNNLYEWAMSQKLPANIFKWVEDIFEFDESFIKSYKGESDEGYFLLGDIHYSENLHKTQNDLPFLPERIKIEKVEKLVANLHDKVEHVIHMRNLHEKGI